LILKTYPMKINLYLWQQKLNVILVVCLAVTSLWVGQPRSQVAQASAQVAAPRRVNVPNLTGSASFTPAIFWFGKVDANSNYVDVRVCYYNDAIVFYVHVIDRRQWIDPNQTASQISQWDSVSFYLNLDGNTGSSPSTKSYRFDAELSNDVQAAYKGNGSTWVQTTNPITVDLSWRGATGPNTDTDMEGWDGKLIIPFTDFGLASAPAQNTIWGLGAVLHDRDDSAGTIRQDTPWPETLDTNKPSTWGQLSFGWSGYTSPLSLNPASVTIRNGLNGASVVDAAVGGHTTCGNDGADKWTSWGSHNYAGLTQFNIQNQWDISDWPCFSKFYVTFPLNSLPAGKTILSGDLKLNLFGTAGGGQWGTPPNSFIEVMTTGADWNESTITWNNAPLALENISGTWVTPTPVPYDYHWDVSKAVAQAYSSGQPLRLVIYSIDGEKHSGKYFFTSDSTDWSGTVRPTLQVTYGSICGANGVICYKTNIPFLVH
jgi:hypothetical protein